MINVDHLPDDLVQRTSNEALRSVAPAVSVIGRALADLRRALPAEHRAQAERAFMNAFGNAVWAEARVAATST